MAVSSTPSSTHGSIGHVSGFSQLMPASTAGSGDEVEEDVIDDGDGGQEDQDPGKGSRRPPADDRVAGRPDLHDDAAQPGGGQRELDDPGAGQARKDARIAPVSQAEAQVPHLVALEQAGRNAKDEGHRREQTEEEGAGSLA